MSCWAGIGVSGNGSMADAAIFIIGTRNSTTGQALVATYTPTYAPFQPAPPTVRVKIFVRARGVRAVGRCQVCAASLAVQLKPDQSEIRSFDASFVDGMSTYNFVTSRVDAVNSTSLIFAFCASNNTTDLKFHGANHS
jgi:hypothetical protein